MKKMIALSLAVSVVAGVWAGGGKEAAPSDKKAAGSDAKTPLVVWMKKGFVEEQNTRFESQVKQFAAMKNVHGHDRDDRVRRFLSEVDRRRFFRQRPGRQLLRLPGSRPIL